MEFAIFETREFDKFRALRGNRTVDANRVRAIAASIAEHGFLPVPIIVNERYEIIDGQHRLEACRIANVPVKFVIQPGASLDECVSLNISARSWNILDYVNSFAAKGNPHYVKLATSITSHKLLTLDMHIFAATRIATMSPSRIKSGEFVVTESDDSIRNTLDLIESIARPRSRTFLRAICYCLNVLRESGKEDMGGRLVKIGNQLKNRNSGFVRDFISAIEAAFNRDLIAKNRIRFIDAYDGYLPTKLRGQEMSDVALERRKNERANQINFNKE